MADRMEEVFAEAIALICGLVLAYFSPITRTIHTEILLKLKEREAQS